MLIEKRNPFENWKENRGEESAKRGKIKAKPIRIAEAMFSKRDDVCCEDEITEADSEELLKAIIMIGYLLNYIKCVNPNNIAKKSRFQTKYG